MSYQLFLYILLKFHVFIPEYTLGLYKIFEMNTIFGVGNTLLWLSNRLKISVVKKWERKHFPKWQFFNESSGPQWYIIYANWQSEIADAKTLTGKIWK